jgi:uncharacterized membrane protein YheB (UPF0754 family)
MHSLVAILIFLPVVGAIIGYVCKWCAIRMLFAPSRFRGIGPFGWQGVVQRRAPKFANGVADTVAEAGVTVASMLAKISDDTIVAKLKPIVAQLAPGVLDASLDAIKPGSSSIVAAPIKSQLTAQIAIEAERVARAVLPRARQEIAAAVDVRKLVVHQLSGNNADRLAKLFQTVGSRELRVVVYYGAVLGFIIGLAEVGFYTALERWWLLPLIGAIDGLINNWLAIQMIFRPLAKTRYLGVFPFQGLFPARQEEIAKDYGEMLAREVLTVGEVVRHLDPVARTTAIANLATAIEKETAPVITTIAPMISAITGAPFDDDAKLRVVRAATLHVQLASAAHAAELELVTNQQLAVAATLQTALAAMPKDRFERVLRGVFEQDEWILVALGGVLGGAIGTLQGALILLLQR